MVLFTSGHKPHLGRRWGREHGRIGADVRLLYGKRKMKGREVNVLKRREAGEITQSLIFRNRKRAKGSKPGKKGGSQECKAVEAEDLDPLSPPPPPPCSPPLTLDSISHFESAHVLCQIALRDCFGGRSLTQFLVHPCNREVKSLSQVVKVANFLDLNKSWSCKHGRGKKRKNWRVWFLCMISIRNKTASHTFLPSFDNEKTTVSLRSRNHVTMVTWRHISPHYNQ